MSSLLAERMLEVGIGDYYCTSSNYYLCFCSVFVLGLALLGAIMVGEDGVLRLAEMAMIIISSLCGVLSGGPFTWLVLNGPPESTHKTQSQDPASM